MSEIKSFSDYTRCVEETAVLPINLLFLLIFVQLVYVGIRWYVKGWRENRGYV